MSLPAAPRMLGRYVLLEELASGGMAQVSLGQLVAPGGFSRLVAIKCLHAQYAKDPRFVTMLFDEARLVSTIRHPNVVPILEVLSDTDPVALVMEYVHGVTLARLGRLARANATLTPLPIVTSIVADLLEGLHAAHDARSETGEPLGIVHRDVSPQNVMVDIEGVARVLDFGVAKAEGRSTATRDGAVKGKAGYMSPEQVRGHDLDRRSDVFAAGVVTWELLVGQRFADASSPVATMLSILERVPRAPSELRAEIPPALDDVVLRALARDANDRFATTRDMAVALEAAVAPATKRDVATWLRSLAGDDLATRAKQEQTALSRAHELTLTVTAAPSKVTWRARRRPTVAVLGVALVGVLALVGGSFTLRTMKATTGPELRPVAPPSEASSTVRLVAAPPSASASEHPASPRASDDAPAGSGDPVRARSKQPPSPRRVNAARCAPPYTVRDDGVHVPKPECLQ